MRALWALGIDATLMIELDGSFATGLRFLAADNEVCGLVLNRFPGPAVDLYHGGIDTLVAGNYIGTDVTGELNLGNGTGVSVDSFANGTVIGGLHPSLRNLLAGNGIGVQITNNHYEYSVVTVPVTLLVQMPQVPPLYPMDLEFGSRPMLKTM